MRHFHLIKKKKPEMAIFDVFSWLVVSNEGDSSHDYR